MFPNVFAVVAATGQWPPTATRQFSARHFFHLCRTRPGKLQRRKEITHRSRHLPGTLRAVGIAVPQMVLQGSQDAFCQLESIAAVLTSHPRPPTRSHAIDEMLEFGSQLIVLAVAIQVQDL